MLGDHLRQRMEIYGNPADPGTIKALMAAAEKGVDVDAKFVESSNGHGNSGDGSLQALSPFGSIPCLKDVEFVVYGTPAVLSYLDDKGFGPSLVPRNGVMRAQMYQWIYVAETYVHPHAVALLRGDGGDQSVREALSVAAQALNERLGEARRGEFIVADYTLAEIHWAAYVHMCDLAGHANIFTQNANVATWWEKVKAHPSTSKERIVAYDILPTKDDIAGGKLKSIYINT